MPPRPPPSPPVLTVLCCVAAGAGAWISLAVDQLGRAAAGLVFGVPLSGFVLSAERNGVLVAVQGPSAHLGPWELTTMVLAGSVAVVALAVVQHVVVGAMRAPGWMRGLSLGWVVVSLLWLPMALAASTLPVPGGPVAELYTRLGSPMAGRWTAGALGLLVLLLTGGVIVERAVSVGRSWMRADGREFRRRLVRVTAGWPGVVAMLALAFGAGWAPTAWALVPCAAVVAVLQAETN